MRHWIALVLLCGTGCGPTEASCQSNTECAPGFVCRANVCIKPSEAVDGGAALDGGALIDGGLVDSGTPDAGLAVDAGSDGGQADAGLLDGGARDGGAGSDAGSLDAGEADAGLSDDGGFTVANADAVLLLGSNRFTTFDTTNPSVVSTPLSFSGVVAGETLVALDKSPLNGVLYGLGINASGNAGHLYALHLRARRAVRVGAPWSTSGSFGMPSTTDFDVDVEPTTNSLRVVTSQGLNRRMSLATGGSYYGVSLLSPGVVIDGPLRGATTSAEGIGYTNSRANASATTLYALDARSDVLCIVDVPSIDGGNVRSCVPTPPLEAVLGFDVSQSVLVADAGAAARGQGVGVVKLSGSTTERLAFVDLSTGAMTTTALPVAGVKSLALLEAPSLSFVGLSLASDPVLFSAASPGAITIAPLQLATLGASVVGLTYRPANGALYALEVDDPLGSPPTSPYATLFRIEIPSAVVWPTSPSAVHFVGPDGTTAIVLPPPRTTGYALDVNPVTDLVHVTTSTGLHFRIDPDTGAPIDGNGGQASQPGVNVDPPFVGVTGTRSLAFTNGVAAIGEPAVTTQYLLNAATNTLFVVSDPDAGVATQVAPVTLDGGTLDFDETLGFDIPRSVRTTATGAPVTSGAGYAALTVNGVTSLYSIDLVTGAAASLGTIGDGGVRLKALTTLGD